MDDSDLEFSKVDSYLFTSHLYQFTVDASGLTPGQLYSFRIRAYNELGWSDFSDYLTVGLGSEPSQPDAVTKVLESSDSTSIMVEWTALTSQTLPVTSYKLYMDDGFGVTFTKVFEADCLEYLVTGLTPAVEYSFKVSAVNYNQEGATSVVRSFKSCVAPSSVASPSLVVTTATSV